jgi:hypothetical protein
MKETTAKKKFYKPNINIDLAYSYFKKMLRAATTKETKPQKLLTKELKEKYRKLHLANKLKKPKKIHLDSNSLPIGTVRIGRNGRKYIKTPYTWLDVETFRRFLNAKLTEYYKRNPHLLLKSTSGKVLKEVIVHGSHGDYKAKRWFKLEDVTFENTFDSKTRLYWGSIELVSQNIFGKRLTKESLARLGGAFEDEKISIEPIGRDMIKITVEGKNHTSIRKISKDRDNRVFISLDHTGGHRIANDKKFGDINAAKGQGTAVNSIYTMIKEAQKFGVTYLKGNFIRTNNGHDGYFKYARLGFDGVIDSKLGVRTVQEFIAKFGLEEWRKRGVRFAGKFDLLQNKKQLKIFSDYVLSLQKEPNYDRFNER